MERNFDNNELEIRISFSDRQTIIQSQESLDKFLESADRFIRENRERMQWAMSREIRPSARDRIRDSVRERTEEAVSVQRFARQFFQRVGREPTSNEVRTRSIIRDRWAQWDDIDRARDQQRGPDADVIIIDDLVDAAEVTDSEFERIHGTAAAVRRMQERLRGRGV